MSSSSNFKSNPLDAAWKTYTNYVMAVPNQIMGLAKGEDPLKTQGKYLSDTFGVTELLPQNPDAPVLGTPPSLPDTVPAENKARAEQYRVGGQESTYAGGMAGAYSLMGKQPKSTTKTLLGY